MSSSDLETRSDRLLGAGVTYLDPGPAVYEAMLRGHINQLKSRRLKPRTIDNRVEQLQAFRKFLEFRYPWEWRPSLFEEFIASLVDSNRALGTIRGYQGAISAFVDYLRDPNYRWQSVTMRYFNAEVERICHEGNMIVHASDYEGRPTKRNFSYDEVERFFSCADERLARIIRDGRKGAFAAFRNATMMKTTYAWGTRRYALTMIDLSDFSANPRLLRLGEFGILTIRYGKAVRGGAPRPYTVFTIPEMTWAADAVRQYVHGVRSHSKFSSSPFLFFTERGTRVGKEHLNAIFDEIRDEAGLSSDLTLHCLRHSFATHQIELGYDRAFVQQQLGHTNPSSTSTYEHVGSDFKQNEIRRAVARAIERAEKYPQGSVR